LENQCRDKIERALPEEDGKLRGLRVRKVGSGGYKKIKRVASKEGREWRL